MTFSEETKKALLGDLQAGHTARAGVNWAQLISVIENIVNQLLPLFGGGTVTPPAASKPK
jgi:hypothetical protein